MKKKLVSSMLIGAMAMMLITGCGEKESSSKNLIEATEEIEATPTDSSEVMPTEIPENTPTETLEVAPTESTEMTTTESLEVTPTESPEVTPTESPEATPTENPEVTPTQKPEATETVAPTEAASLTKEEAEQLLVGQYGMEDPGTGNANSFGYENTVTIDGVQYYNFRWSRLVDDHMSYVTNLAVALDGSGIYEVTYDEHGDLKLVN